MLRWLASLFKAPQRSGPPRTIGLFGTVEPTIARTNIAVHQDVWLIDTKEKRPSICSSSKTRKRNSV